MSGRICEKCNKECKLSYSEYGNKDPNYCICLAINNYKNECSETYYKEWYDVFLKNITIPKYPIKNDSEIHNYILHATTVANKYIQMQEKINKMKKDVIEKQLEKDGIWYEHYLRENYSKKEK